MQQTGGEAVPQFRRSHQWETVRALLQRANIQTQANNAFHQAYPDAPTEMLNAATFHTYIEGIGAVIDWLVSLESFLQDPSRELNPAETFHVLYHLYNWQQLSNPVYPVSITASIRRV